MNNWQRFQEKIDVWIMRYSSEATASYWGINNINKTEADKIIQSLEVALSSILIHKSMHRIENKMLELEEETSGRQEAWV